MKSQCQWSLPPTLLLSMGVTYSCWICLKLELGLIFTRQRLPGSEWGSEMSGCRGICWGLSLAHLEEQPHGLHLDVFRTLCSLWWAKSADQHFTRWRLVSKSWSWLATAKWNCSRQWIMNSFHTLDFTWLQKVALEHALCFKLQSKMWHCLLISTGY